MTERGVRRIGVWGGSFNPPHIAHVLAATLVRSWDQVDHVLVVPVFQHPFAKDLAPFEHRFAMCQRAFAVVDGVIVSGIERDLGGESLTLRTLQALSEQQPHTSFRLMIGSDVVADLPKWHRWDAIAALAPPLVFDRKGATDVPERALLPEVSSTEIRASIAAGKSSEIAHLLPGLVRAYVEENGLYALPNAGPASGPESDAR